MTPPRVAVIVLNWNGAPHLAACLDSVAALTYPEREVLVVDNASTDGSGTLPARYPGFALKQNPENLGYAGGNNVGIRATAGAYVLLVNNDAVLDRGLLEPLVAAAEADPRVASCAPAICYLDRPDTLNAAGITIAPDGSSGSRGRDEPVAQYGEAGEVFGAHGACVLYRRAALEQVGLLDEAFFAYNEEFDLAWRLRLSGYTARYVPAARALHAEAASSRTAPERILYLMERNRLWCVLKNMGVAMLLRHAPALLAAEWRMLRHCAGIGTVTPLRARLAALAGLPRMLSRRADVQRRRTVPDREIERWMIR